MAAFWLKFYKQTAVYYAQNGTDSFGRPKFAAPVEFRCRWQQEHKLFLDGEGQQAVSDAKVMIEDAVKEGGFLFEGVLADAPADPLAGPDCYEIRKYERIPDLKNKAQVHIAML